MKSLFRAFYSCCLQFSSKHRSFSTIQPGTGNHRFPYERLSKIHLTAKALRDFNEITPQPSKSYRNYTHSQLTLFEGQSPTLPELGIDEQYHIDSGGPELSDLRGCCSSMSAKEASIHESESTADEEPTIHDWNFEQILTDTGCFGDWNTLELPKPQNWNELRSMLVENPVQCTESDLKEFVNKRGLGRNERTINVTKLFPGILDSDAIPHEQDQVFDNLEPSIDGLPDAKPDFFDGMFPAQVDSQVLQGLSRFIMPSTKSGAPVLPNFTLNAMGSDSYALALKRRALYNGTLGARAIHQAQCYQQEPSFDEHAYTISVTLYDDVLRNYATHPGLHAGLVHYYKNQLHAYMLDSTNSQSFKRGLTALRNARLWAKGQGEKIVETANSRIDATTLIRPPSSSGTSSGTLAGSQSMNEIVESSVATTRRKAPQTVETQQSKRPKA